MNGLNMNGLLRELANAEQGIADMFGLDELWHKLIDCTGYKFVFDICTDDVNDAYTIRNQINVVTYGFKNIPDIDNGNCYSVEVYGTSVWFDEEKRYVLVVGDYNGEQHMYLFDMQNNNNQEESEYIEQQY